MRKAILWWGLLLLLASVAQAQDNPAPVQVFLKRGQPDQLQFVDVLTGDIRSVEVTGERYTLFGRGVMFYDPSANRVMLATPDSRVRNHPFIQPLPTTRRVDWKLSADGTLIAWTLTTAQADGQLVTLTRVAGSDGGSPREVLSDGPRAAIRALPVAFSADHRRLYLDYQPDSIGAVTPFQQYAGLFQLDLESGETSLLPGEPGCFCGAGLGPGLLLRLQLADNLSGFDVMMVNLAADTSVRIAAVGLSNYTQAGGVLIAPDSTRALYALAQVSDFGGANQSVRTVFVLVDLVKRVQTRLSQPLTSLIVPIEWTEDNEAVILSSVDPEQDGTWKLDLDDGRTLKVSDATYLGTLH